MEGNARAIALMMEGVRTSETSVKFCETTQCNVPKDTHLRNQLWAIQESYPNLFGNNGPFCISVSISCLPAKN
jgi:hypothetical protein